MSKTVLILGGYGVFGGRLAQMLTGDSRFDVVIAGRDLSKAEAFCEQHGGRPLQLDRQGDQFGTVTADLSPFIVVDAAGPFQAYGNSPYSVAEAALSIGAHYLDFSDDAAFTAGISLLDDKARTRGLVALSGVSSVPALSSAAVAELTDGLTDIHLIESAILPGNRAPRGLSVVRSILGQAGRPLELWRGNHWTTAKGWGDNRPVDIGIAGTAPLRSRWASLIGAPDLVLFPTQYRARSVIFRAGLELKLMHGGLALLSRLVRWRLLNSLEPLAPTLKWTAERLERFGTDRGGMLVRVIARQADTRLVSRCWKLIVEAGDGPSIPAIPARVLCEKLADDSVTPGARACLAEFSLRDAERAMSTLSIRTGRGEAAASVLFPDAVGQEDFDRLPGGVQDLHCLVDQRDWSGRASITRGRGLLSRVAAWFAGFPPAGDDVPVQVRMMANGQTERWSRAFGRRRFRSVLSRRRDGRLGVTERFGVMSFDIDLQASETGLGYPVSRGRVIGIPLPKPLLPRSETREFVDGEGRVRFDVSISLPVAGHVVRYEGWLEPDES